MPVYVYHCNECNQTFELKRSYEDADRGAMCPRGHINVRRVFTRPTIVFKGSGFYSTDHRKSG